MDRRPPRRQNRATGLAGRIERAAGDINPFLIVIAIGLFVLNVLCFALLAANRPPARRDPGTVDATTTTAGPRVNPAMRLGVLQ